jgi:hypothetical protein
MHMPGGRGLIAIFGCYAATYGLVIAAVCVGFAPRARAFSVNFGPRLHRAIVARLPRAFYVCRSAS